MPQQELNVSSAASPLPIFLWSIKETEKDKKIANCFPYDGNAGDGTFFAMVRTKLGFPEISRDQENNIVLDNLSLIFEDVVKKSADIKNDEDIPGTSTIATFHFPSINSGNFINEGETILGDIENENSESQEQKLIELKKDYLKSGFYKGQVASYFNRSIETIKFKIQVNWYNVPTTLYGASWQIFIKDKNGDNVAESLIYLAYETTNIYFELPCFDESGNLINYNVEEKIYLAENDWNVEISQKIINYKSTKSIISNNYQGN